VATVPGPRGLWLTGNLVAIGRDVLGFLERTHAAHGDVVRVRIASMPIYVVSSPAAARHVLLTRRDNYDKTSRSSLEIRHISGASLLTANGADWHDKRHVLQPAFRAEAIGRYHQVMRAAAADAVNHWRSELPEGGTIDMAHEMMRLTYRIVSAAMLGENLRSSADTVDQAMRTMLGHVAARLRAPSLPLAWPTPSNTRFHRARRRLHAVVDDLIARRRALRREPRDLLDAMIAATGDRQAPLDDAWLRDEVATLLLAGHETTANALSWTWYLLSRHPEVQQRAVAAARSTDDPVACAYLRQVLFESLRLYPPIWLMERRAREADVIDGHPVPAGANVAVATWLLHRHPEYWPDPGRFDPDRFADSQHHGRPGDHYLPFGLGPRTCLGLAFAVHEAAIVLAACLAHMHTEAVPGAAAVVPQPGITLRPKGGLPLRLVWRD
jgi:cytochrome P450